MVHAVNNHGPVDRALFLNILASVYAISVSEYKQAESAYAIYM